MTAKENPTPATTVGQGKGRLSVDRKGRFVSYTVSQTDFRQRPVVSVDGKPERVTDGG